MKRTLHKSRLVVIAVALAIAFAFAVEHFDLHFKCNGQQFGIYGLRSHYRGLFMSFRDGVALRNGRYVPVTFNDDGSLLRYGYRRFPRFYYLSMPEWKADMYAIGGL